MADNVTAPAAGVAFATDDIAGVHWPFAKMAFGPRETAHEVEDAAGKRLPVLAYLATGGVVALDAATLAALENIQAAVTGTVALDAATLAALENIQAAVTGTVELGSTSLAALETIGIGQPLPSGTNNIGDVDVASVPATATTTRAYAFAAGQRITTSGTGQVRSDAVAATEVLLHPSVRGFFRVGDASVTATVGAGSIPLAADEKFHLRITSGQFISFIRDGATDGSLSIVPVA